jgi:hypothetical protein
MWWWKETVEEAVLSRVVHGGGGSAEMLKQSRSAGSSLRIKRCFYGGRRSLRSIYIGSSLVLAGAMEVESVCLPS